MIEQNRRLGDALRAAMDSVLIYVAYLLAVITRFWGSRGTASGIDPALDIARDPRVMAGMVLYALGMVLVYIVVGLYKKARLRGLWWQLRTIGLLNALGVLCLGTALYQLRMPNFSRLVLGYLYLFSIFMLAAERVLVRQITRHQQARGIGIKRVLLVGGGPSAGRYLKAIRRNPYYGFRVVGYLAPQESKPFTEIFHAERLGTYSRLEEFLDTTDVDEVIVALEADESALLPQVFAACDKNGVRITMVPFYNEYLPARPTVDVIDDCKLINVRETPFDHLGNAFLKRLLDVVFSFLLIVLTSPVMIITAVGVRLSSPGPILFRQERVGLNKKTFQMYKFRSMRMNADEATAWSTDEDPRKTRFGSLIRKFSLDELPQFFNVLKGDMSLVGPRPEIPYHVEHFKNEIPLYLVRQQVRPGCTGWAQVNGLRGDTDIAERIRYDIWYIENWTVGLDLRIVFRTVFGGKMINNEKLG